MMLSLVKKIIYNPLICYLPIILTVAIFITYLLHIGTNICPFKGISNQCLLIENTNMLSSNPILLLGFSLLLYTCFYLYYNIYFGNHLVARAVETIYDSISNNLNLERESKQILLWLICYGSTLLFSYFLLPVLVFKKRVLNE